MDQSQTCLHGTCISIGDDGVLILGAPGSGKSDLALRLIDAPGSGISGTILPCKLVSDDQVIIRRGQGGLIASAPTALHGKLEIRGLGIVTLETLPSAPLALVARLQAHAAIERLPSPATFDILGHPLPIIEIDAASASAPARLRAALNWLKRQNGGM